MIRYLLPILLLVGCASPDGALLRRHEWPTGPREAVWSLSHEIPFTGGRVLGLTRTHLPEWHPGTNPFGERYANGFRWTRKVGHRVDLVTAWGVIPGTVQEVSGSECLVRLGEDWEYGYSGAGLWYGDDWLAGYCAKGSLEDPRVILAVIPFMEER